LTPLRHLTQEQLAEKSDLSSKMVSLVERFKRNPSLNIAESIAQGLGVPLWQLIREADEIKRKK
jgi:transcriptional regulator with XRE-family HTH domain